MARKKIQFFKEKERELGFGTSSASQRIMNKDGRSNVERRGVHVLNPINLYHFIITIPWWKFNLIVVSYYLCANLVFASMYYYFGIDQLSGMIAQSNWEKYTEAFFFSAQTLTTVGYGRINPTGNTANIIAAIESLTGLLGFALATGLLYGRFSRPTAKLLFSRNAVMAPFREGTAFMFRLANARFNSLIEIEAQLMLGYDEQVNDKTLRRFQQLKLDLPKINFLALSWTVVHPVDEDSPLKGLSAEDLKQMNAEFVVMMKAVDDTYAQTVHTRTSYLAQEIIWNAKFTYIIEQNMAGKQHIDINRIHEFEKL